MFKRNSSARTLSKSFRIALFFATLFGLSACDFVHLNQGAAIGGGRVAFEDGEPSFAFDLELQFESEAGQSDDRPGYSLKDNHAAREQMFAALSALEGLKEIAGPDHEPIIQDMHANVGLPTEPDETAWCSSAINWVAKQAGVMGSGSAAARSWLGWSSARSIELSEAMPGDVVIFWRESPNSWKGHVGLYVGLGPDANTILVLGGNQGNGTKVSIEAYAIDRLLGVRRVIEH